jgi:hypothetical protein
MDSCQQHYIVFVVLHRYNHAGLAFHYTRQTEPSDLERSFQLYTLSYHFPGFLRIGDVKSEKVSAAIVDQHIYLTQGSSGVLMQSLFCMKRSHACQLEHWKPGYLERGGIGPTSCAESAVT